MRNIIHQLTVLLLILVSLTIPLKAVNTNITGFVNDAITGEPLIGANIVLLGTSMGASSDMNGKYIIPNVVPGTYTIRVSYIGYGEIKSEIIIKEGESIKKDFALEPVGVKGQEIVVTGQAYGQTQAINEQLASMQISSVVSSARIQELPDNTVAESVGRLPGVTVLRSGGEGNEVVVRGLEPKYNQITIDGVEMSSSSIKDRSSDLSMISSNMLDGIQVTKSVTADMDANVVGGTINFQLHEARSNEFGRPVIGLLTQGTYNNLSNAYNKFNNYKYVGSIENRFFENDLGVFLQFDVERKNLTSNEYGGIFDHAPGNDYVNTITNGLNLNNIPRDRQRYNLAFVMDYKLPQGKIKTSNFFSSGNTDVQNRGEGYYVYTSPTTINQHQYSLASTNNKLGVITNTLLLDQQLPIFHLNASFAHSYSENRSPNDWTVTFVQTSAGLSQFTNAQNINPQDVPKAATNNLDQTFLNTFVSNYTMSRQRSFIMQADLDADVNLSDFLSAKIKFGGKYKYQTRKYNFEQFDGQGLSLASARVVDDLIISYLNLPSSLGSSIPIGYFQDNKYDYGNFLDGNYKMISPLHYGMLTGMADMLKNNLDYIAQNGGAIAYSRNTFQSISNDYNGVENQGAFYLMSVINIGQDITVIPGIRYQNLKTKYTAARGIQAALSFYDYNYYDTTVILNHGYWLPDISLKYKPFSWFDVRMAYSNTIAYPDYNTITPRIDVGFIDINYNNFQLTPARSTNYDIYFSFYENSIGLLTVGGYYKEIKDFIFPWNFHVSGAEAIRYYPPSKTPNSNPTGNYNVVTYVNNPYKIQNYGVELDWQTHFWYLPGVLSGLVFNMNYTHIFSKAQYPFVFHYRPTPRSAEIRIDTSYIDRLLDQPNDIINISLGYDFKGFSARISMINQANIFTGTNYWPSLRKHTDTYTRWDFSAKQELPWFGIQIFGNINNLNGAKDISIIQGAVTLPSSEQDYGMNADLGIRVKF